jgi:hypothetical protein
MLEKCASNVINITKWMQAEPISDRLQLIKISIGSPEELKEENENRERRELRN